jgi:AcrR family transcriptional regulator
MTTPTETGTDPPAGRAPGRPRQADVEPRCYEAVLAVFGQHGWAGLSLDAVAAHAGIGKSTIYLRWKTKRDLLLEAVRYFETQRKDPVDDGQPLREYLIEYGIARGRLLLGPHGPTMLNIASGAITSPEDFNDIRRERSRAVPSRSRPASCGPSSTASCRKTPTAASCST